MKIRQALFAFSGIFITNGALSQKQFLFGQQLFEAKCAKCHGKNGGRGFFGAADLRMNRLRDDQLFQSISKGKNRMPSWEKRLNSEQIKSIITYIKTLRK